MHSAETRADVLQLAADGWNDGAIARELGLPRTTVRDIRVPRRIERPLCHRCWRPARPVWFTPGEYAELLGLYFGDGHVSQLARTQRLRLSLDSRHFEIVKDAVRLLTRCFAGNHVRSAEYDGGATSVVYVYSSHMACLLPQHGAEKVGVRCRPTGTSVRIYRREDVAQFAAYVGAKW